MRIAAHIILAFLLLLYSFALNGQSNSIDSLQRVLLSQKEDTNRVNTWIASSDAYYKENDTKNALAQANMALNLSQKILFKKGEGYAWLSVSRVYFKETNYSEAIGAALHALKNFKEINLKPSIAQSYFALGDAYTNGVDRYEANKNYYSALKIYEEIGDKKRSADCLTVIGFNYYAHENYQQSFTSFYDALKLYKEIGLHESFNSGICYTYMANIYRIQRKYPEAFRYDSIGLKIAMQNGYTQLAANAYSSIGDILSEQADAPQLFKDHTNRLVLLKEALKNYFESLKNFRNVEFDDAGGMGDSYQHLSETYVKLQQLQEAQEYADSALLMAKKINFLDNLSKSYQVQAKIDSAKGNYKRAYSQYKLYILYRDSMINNETTKKALQSRLEYDFEKKETVAKAEQLKKDAEVKRTRNLQYTAIGIVLLLAIFLYWNSRQKQKAKTKIEKAYTELKTTQQQLIQSEKMASLGELTAGIAHEIQNPLNFVNNFSEVNDELIGELVEEVDKGNTEEVKTIANDIKLNLEKINHHGKRADAIVKGMLQHSRTSTGQKEPTDINALADEYLRLAYHGLRAKDKSFNATMKTDFDNSIGKIKIIRQDIGRVILNLINNAFYAVSERQKVESIGYEPTVVVSTKKSNGNAEISVKDNGNGIPQNIVDKIFQPFFTTKPTGQGTGLGLSLAYDIIKAQGGEIKVETKEGESSEFIIQLPLKENSP